MAHVDKYLVTRNGARLYVQRPTAQTVDTSPLLRTNLNVDKFFDFSRNSWSVGDVREVIWYANQIKDQFGTKALRAVRVLSSNLSMGFADNWTVGGLYGILDYFGIGFSLEKRKVCCSIDGRCVRFVDDYYWTGLRFLLREVLSDLGLPFPLLSQRGDNSVKRLGLDLVALLAAGRYHDTVATKFYGAKDIHRIKKPLCLTVNIPSYRINRPYIRREHSKVLHEPISLDVLMLPAKLLRFYNNSIDAETYRSMQREFKRHVHDNDSFYKYFNRAFEIYSKREVLAFIYRSRDRLRDYLK